MADGDFNHFPAMAAALPDIMGKLIRKCCFDIQAQAMSRCAVATGFLKSSIYVLTKDTNTYGQTSGDGPMLPPIPTPSTPLEGWVGVGAAYGLWVEMGSKHGPAQPYLMPAAEAVLPQFQQAAQALEDHFKQVT